MRERTKQSTANFRRKASSILDEKKPLGKGLSRRVSSFLSPGINPVADGPVESSTAAAGADLDVVSLQVDSAASAAAAPKVVATLLPIEEASHSLRR